MFGAPANNSPFGSPQPTGGFGSPAPAPFGAPAPAFGAPAFGTPAPAPAFGAPATGFGAPAPAPGGFGSSTFGSSTNTFGGGGFGSSAPAPAFGSSGGFGSTNNASPFGAPAPAPGGLFGSAPAPSGGLFGSAPAPAFGASPAPAFGSSTFGAPTPAPAFGSSAFGAPAPSTGLFGSAPTPAPSAFGSTFGSTPAPAFGAAPAPPPGSIFGAPAPAPGGLFSAPAPAAGQPGAGGTKATPYQPTNRQDGTSTISMQSISAMSAYENKNFDELRYEDYLQGNKGAGNTASTGFGGFGAAAPAPTGGLFGSAPAPAFGAPSTSPFGAPAPAPFGAPAPAPFGAPAPAFGSAFGAPTPAPAFGAAPTPAFGSTFGKPASGSLFGAPAPAPGGLFGGGAPAPAPAFGAPTPAPGGLFGAPAPAPGGLFGAPTPAPGGLFGATPAPAFGSPAPAPAFGTFGAAPAPSTGLFGAPAPPPAFGAPAPGGLFGAPAPAAGGLFGAKPPGTGLFGAPAPAPFGSPPAFGAPAAAPSLFGSPPAATVAPAIPPAGSIIPQAASEVLSHQIQALENKRKEVQKLDVWRGKSPDESRVTPVSQPQYGGLSSGMVRTSPYTPHRHTPGSAAKKLRPRGFGAAIASPTTTSASPLDTMGTGGRAMMSPESYAASSAKKLVIKQDSLVAKPKLRLRLTNTPANGDNVTTTHALPVSQQADSPANAAAGTTAATIPAQSTSTPRTTQGTATTPSSIPVFGATAATPGASSPRAPRAPTAETIDLPPDPDRDYYQQVIDSPDGNPESRAAPRSAPAGSSVKKKPSCMPKLTKAGYMVSPSLHELAAMSEADLAAVIGFSVSHEPYGLVQWDGAVDVRNADLDSSIVIGQNDVSVYTRDEDEGRKPPVGSKLNRSAVITFKNVFSKNGGADADEDTKLRFARRIERQTAKMDAELILYDKDTGEWKIRVQHFSRYGLLGEDDDDDDEHFQPTAADSDYEDEAAVVSDVEMEKEPFYEQHLEDAYESIYDAVKTYSKQPKAKQAEADMEVEPESDEEEFDEYYESDSDGEALPSATLTSEEDYSGAVKQHATNGITNRLSWKAFSSERRIPKNVEYGHRLGRSFRVGWSPDGSFLQLAPGGTRLERRRPLFDDPQKSWDRSKRHLETHKAFSSKLPTEVDDRSPRFVLPKSISNNAGDAKSHELLHEALATFKGEGEEVGSLAFALLACLVDDPRIRGAFLNERRKEAVARFLTDAVRGETKRDVEAAMARNDSLSAIQAALKGGNVSTACEIAVNAGNEDLAACIAAGSSHDLAAQARKAAAGAGNEGLREVYRLLSGSLNLSKERSWMRCLLMKLLFTGLDLSDVLKSYTKDFESGRAPYPSPTYLRGGQGQVQSILFRLLHLAEGDQATVSCADVIDPSGVSKYHHDFSVSFHLASALAAAGICPSLSAWQEESLIDGYCTQLIGIGRWEWAVYVCLCSLNPDMLDSSSTDWKQAKAKSIILQFYHKGDPLFGQRSMFLSEVGVPTEWCSEALAYRYASKGEPFSYIDSLVSFAPGDAVAVCEQVILPNILFMKDGDVQKVMELFGACHGDLSPAAKAVLCMFDIGQDLRGMAASPSESDPQLSEMKNLLTAVEKKFHVELSKCKKGKASLQFSSKFNPIPLQSMLSEAIDHCVFLQLKLKALQMGIEIGASTSLRKLTALLAFSAIGGKNEHVSGAVLLR